MGALKNTRCYLSSPIECDNGRFEEWRLLITKTLTERFEVNVFDPSKDIKQTQTTEMDVAMENEDYKTVERIAKLFTRKDLAEIDRCSFLVACVIKNVPTTGVPCEVVHAISLKKPVMIVSPLGKKTVPKWYWGNMHHEYIFGSLEDLFGYLGEVDAFEHKSNHRWWYTYNMV